jgi:hypothetical protein
MKVLFCLIIMAFLLILVATSAERSRKLPNRLTPPVTKDGQTLTRVCMTESKVSDKLEQLANSDRTTEQQNIAATLRDNASQSASCRTQLVTLLIAKLEKSDRDLLLNLPSFFLWHYGGKLLSDLKAVEAMDLLIANFELHDGSPYPFDHHPALLAACHIGEKANTRSQVGSGKQCR